MMHSPLGVMDAIVTFQEGTDLERTYRQPLLDFSRLEHAQTAHEHAEQPTTQLGSVSFVDAIMSKRITYYSLPLGSFLPCVCSVINHR